MPSDAPAAYKFRGYLLNPADKLLLHHGRGVALPPKVFDTLLILVESHGRLVGKDEFLQRLWPDTVVEEVSLAHCISNLRKVLGDATQECRFIETVPKRGYRFIAATEVIPAASYKASDPVRLAVLPFENMDASPEREYLADGFTEETIVALGQIDPNRLSVIGRTSVAAYKRTTKSLADIGRELEAAYLIESSIRTEGGRLRITSKLIRAHGQVQIWSACYDGEPRSMLAFQRELSTAIAEQIRLQLSPERLAALARRQTQNAEAYDLYLRGRHCWNQLTPASTRRATEYYSRATTLDANYALAWSGLADAYASAPVNGDMPALDAWSLARDAAAHAIAAEADLAEAQASQGLVDFWLEWDWPAAEFAFEKAITLDPSYPLAHRTLGIVLSHMGRHDEARPAIRRARELDPLNAMNHALSAQVAFAARDYSAAVGFARHAIIIAPEFWVGHYQLAQAYEQAASSELALDAIEHAWRLSAGNSKVAALRSYVLAKLDRAQEARSVLKELEARARLRHVPPYALALVHAGLGELDLALSWLERAYEAHDVHLAFLTVDPKWDLLRADSRFVALIGRCAFMSLLIGRREIIP